MSLFTKTGLAGWGLGALLLSACSLAPNYVRPELPVPPGIAAASAGQGAAMETSFDLGWREFFQDQRLLQLIATSLEHNRDLRIAVLNVAEARATYRVQNAERFPELEAGGTGTWTGSLENSDTGRTYEIAAMPAFELDVFGRLRSMSDSTFQSYLSTAEAARAVRIALVSEVAQAYLAERLAGERLELARKTLASWERSYAFIRNRLQSGQSSLLELEQAKSMVEAARAAVAEREREVVLAGNALQLLTGTYESDTAFTGSTLARQAFASLPENVSSSVLLRRPDVMEAEHALRAANADIGAARAAFFPSISLTGSLGYMSDDLATLVSGATSFWSFLPRVTLPIFNAGRNSANLELAEIRKDASIAAYEKAIQTAFREVADGLMSRASYDRQLEAQQRYLASQQTVLKLATSRYTNGVVSYLEVLDAQRAIFEAEQALLGIRRDQLVNDVNLFGALGGGPEAGGRPHHATTASHLYP